MPLITYAPASCKPKFYSFCIYFIELHCNELYFIHCFNMDLESAINVYTYMYIDYITIYKGK